MKKKGFLKITAVFIIFIFGVSLLLGLISPYIQNKFASTGQEIPDEQVWLPQDNSNSAAQQAGTGSLSKYATISSDGNIDAEVVYFNPSTGVKDTLSFGIALGTHSVDLSGYKDISKNVELKTDAGVTISDGFEWTLESSESHHISGTLRLKNEISGKPVIGADTKSFSIIIENIPDKSRREHVYKGDMLK